MTGKRVVAHLAGGLGNQLFIYAAAWALSRRLDATLQFDTAAFARDWEYKRKFALHHFRGPSTVPLRDYAAADLLHRVYRKVMAQLTWLPPRLGPLLGERADEVICFDPAWNRLAPEMKGALHVFGFCQNEAYFADHAAALRAELTLLFAPSPEAEAFADEMRATQAVCVNLRRLHEVIPGTNIPKPGMKVLGAEYYHSAVNLVRERFPDAVFYCFGDTLEGVHTLLPRDTKVVLVPALPDRPADICDFWVMQQCRHYVIANSTFGWWAAWLGQKSGSMVVCPVTEGFQYKVAPAKGWIVT